MALGFVANGCNRVDGGKFADKVNERMVAKIDKGEVKSELDIVLKLEDASKEALKEMGHKEDAGVTESQKKVFEEKLAKYQTEWSKRLAQKNGG